MSHQQHFCRGPVSRRSFMEIGSLALGGLCLSDLLRMRAYAEETTSKPAPDTSVILLWLGGGPSHIDMYDMKPKAPDTIRSPFKEIGTNLSGLNICELMPMQAKIADKFTLIRSITHKWNGHQDGAQRFLSGYAPPRGAMNTSAYPNIGSVVTKMREGVDKGIPNYISSNAGGIEYVGSSYLGKGATPFVVDGDPSAANFKVKNLAPPKELEDSLDDRAKLLKSLDLFQRDLDRSGSMGALDKFNQQALTLLTSKKVRKAFDLSQEPDHIRDRYGRNRWGQRALLARRLVEAGSSFVSMDIRNSNGVVPKGSKTLGNWDSHSVNCHIFDELKVRLPYYDQVVSALIDDVHQRGLDKKVMIIVAGEFGRTPKIETTYHGAGRGHYAKAQSVIVSGGNMKMGQVIGSTDEHAAEPKDRPLSPNDLLATIYHHLGIDTYTAFPDLSGRPTRILSEGEPIKELL